MRGQEDRETEGKKNAKEDPRSPLLSLTMSWGCSVVLNNPRFLKRKNNVVSQFLIVLKMQYLYMFCT